MKFLDEQFRELDEELKINEQSKEQLKQKILQNVTTKEKRPIKQYGWIAVAVCLVFVVTLPFYSPTMASIVGKVLPIKITPHYSEGQYNPNLTAQLLEFVEQEGYSVGSVGITPSPYTIEVSLLLKDSTLKQATKDLEPKITNYLYENGYDEFELLITEAKEVQQDPHEDEETKLYDEVREIVKEVFTSYGYAEEADYELAGFKSTWFSNIVTLDMPDHIEESDEIIAEIKKEFESRKLKIKDIEVTTFNLAHRLQDNRWAYIAADIYNAMAGKSTYHLTGVSYKVRKGHSYVSIKTALTEPPSEEIIKEIELAIQEYFALPEKKEQLQNDDYTIQLELENGEPFVKVTK
ncbi:hypothetical protein QUF56_02450 [Ureibacillus composti]|nr:hypothetical protein [Ureibacillus composti]